MGLLLSSPSFGWFHLLLGGWVVGWMDIWISPHFLPPAQLLFSVQLQYFHLVTGPLVIEGLVSCGWKSYRSLTLGFTGVFYSFAFGDFVVVVVFKRYFCA